MKFKNFLKDMGEPPKGTFLDRRKNHLGYSKRNCRWVTPKESTENRANTVWIEMRGQRIRVNDFAKKFKIPIARLYYRVRAGWTADEMKSQVDGRKIVE
jgi:hypothetical protein